MKITELDNIAFDLYFYKDNNFFKPYKTIEGFIQHKHNSPFYNLYYKKARIKLITLKLKKITENLK